MLEIAGLRVVYPNRFEALRSVDLTVRAGEIVALVGRSGAGKSTLLRCINGLQPVTAGSVRLNGVDIARLDAAEMRALRRQIGFIWQEYNVVERLSVVENVLTGRLGHCGPISSLFHYFDNGHRQVALRSLERVNLLHRATQRADRLSGGGKDRKNEEIQALFESCPNGKIAMLHYSDPIPNTPFAIRSDLPVSLKDAVRDALLSMKDDADFVKRSKRWYLDPSKERGLKSLDAYYDPLREIAKKLELDLKKLD